MTAPALVLCAHGTDDPQGRQVVRSLAAAVAAAHPGLRVHDAYVDVQQPRVGSLVASLAGSGADVTVVPLLLSGGYHLEVDVADAVAPFPHARAAGALGPHALLAEVLVSRLREAGAGPSDAVVLAVAGSSRESGSIDAHRMTQLLQERWSGEVRLGFCSAATPSVAEAVSAARGEGATRVVVASYLLGPGFFQRLLGRTGADLVTAPLGADRRLVDVIGQRWLDARSAGSAR